MGNILFNVITTIDSGFISRGVNDLVKDTICVHLQGSGVGKAIYVIVPSERHSFFIRESVKMNKGASIVTMCNDLEGIVKFGEQSNRYHSVNMMEEYNFDNVVTIKVKCGINVEVGVYTVAKDDSLLTLAKKLEEVISSKVYTASKLVV